MSEEFKLSEKVFQITWKNEMLYLREDVKEFIRRLKERIDILPTEWKYSVNNMIDSLAGDELI